MKTPELVEWLKEHDACEEAIAWVRTQPSYAQAWRTCPRVDWLLWFAKEAGVEHVLLVRAGCDCAETVLRYVPADEPAPRVAIETARALCRGEASIKDVKQAYVAADAAAYSAADAAAYSASAAAAYSASVAAADAADAAARAAYAAVRAAYAAVRAHPDPIRAHRKLATIVRRRIKRPELT